MTVLLCYEVVLSINSLKADVTNVIQFPVTVAKTRSWAVVDLILQLQRCSSAWGSGCHGNISLI